MKNLLPTIMKVIIVLIITILTACGQKQFRTSPPKPVPGGEVTIMYTPPDPVVKNATTIKMEYSSYSSKYDGFEHIEDTRSVALQKEGNTWIAVIHISANTEIVAAKFLPDNTAPDNNNGEGYFIRTHDSKGNESIESLFGHATSYISWAVFNGYVNRDFKKGKGLLEELFALYPDMKERYIRDWLTALRNSTPDSLKSKVFSMEMEEALAYETISDDDYKFIIWFCRNHGMPDKAEEAEKLALKKYPNGKVAYDKKYELFENEPDILKMMEMARELEKDFHDKFAVPPSGIVFSIMVKQKRFDLLPGWWKVMVSEYNLSPGLYWWLADQLVKAEAELQIALDICEKGDAALRNEQINHVKGKIAYVTEERAEEIEKRDHSFLLATWARALRAADRKEEAVRKYEEAFLVYPVIKFQDGDIVAYSALLTETKSYDNALIYLEEIKRAGISAPGVDESLKQIWVERNGTDKGFETYMAELEAEGIKAEIEKQRKLMISQPAPDFTLTDLDGNIITLSEHHGKVVILDFWATWCGPCKASFPAMQMVVDKYASDTTVKFFFINTRETATDKKENARKFLEESNYAFHALLDNDNKVNEVFKVSGIPTKFVIDGKGNIRFNVLGVSGTTDEMILELTSMIELAKEE